MTAPVLVVVAHGSRDPASARVHQGLLRRLEASLPGTDVRLAYVDHVAPPVAAVLRECAAQGSDTVVVPLLLSPATHARGDIPAAVRSARAVRSGTRSTYARVLGPHPLLLRAMDRRLAEAGAGGADALVLAAAGSADPDANSEVARVARLLWEWRGGRTPVEPAFASGTRPGVAEAVGRLRTLGHGDIAVVSYFLAPGHLPDRVVAEAGGLPVTQPFADTDEVAEVVRERYLEARTGLAAVNCDLCVHRSTWPGHEHRVGEPQRIHPHPFDVRPAGG